MLKERLMMKMAAYYSEQGLDVPHYTAHCLRVWGYAHTIGTLEGLDEHTQNVLEMAAIVHDISIPTNRKKYGKSPGNLQESESEAILRPFLEEFELSQEDKERIVWLVSHHHTYHPVDGMDHQILLEADYLVNAHEHPDTKEAILKFRENVYRTETGKQLLDSIYKLGKDNL